MAAVYRLTALLILAGALAGRPAAASPADRPEAPATPLPDVVGGTIVPDGEWRDTAAILFDGSAECTGVLVAPNVVLTAGHCAGGITQVQLDSNDLREQGERIDVIQETAYPRWFQSHDITVLVLDHDSVVPPRQIGNGCIAERYLVNGAPVQIVGYGATDEQGNVYPNEMHEARTTITDFDCESVDRGCEPSISPGGELGAGGMGIDTCFGDSGGPAYLVTDRGDFLVGLTSRGWSDVTVPCADGGIYVRPDAVMDWIETTAGVDLPDASCNAAPAPTALEIDVEAGHDGTTTVSPNDPDTGDGHSFAIGAAPTQGTAEVDASGVVTYHAPPGASGDDSLSVVVTDDGDPSASGEVVIAVVITDSGGCGCRAASSPRSAGGLLVLGLLVALALRRRS